MTFVNIWSISVNIWAALFSKSEILSFNEKNKGLLQEQLKEKVHIFPGSEHIILKYPISDFETISTVYFFVEGKTKYLASNIQNKFQLTALELGIDF